jgi:hypothetical protein
MKLVKFGEPIKNTLEMVCLNIYAAELQKLTKNAIDNH